MPKYKPGGTLPIVFDCDADQEAPLTFIVRVLSVAECVDLGERLDAILNQTSGDWLRALCDVIEPFVVGWENGPEEYSWGGLLRQLDQSDLWRLAWSIKRQIGHKEKKA
jgi:hypothetical protein